MKLTAIAVGLDGLGRTWSLRREWTRAFNIMLVLLLVASLGTFVGVGQLVGRFSGTSHQLERELTVVASLQTGLIAHEATAHQLLAGSAPGPPGLRAPAARDLNCLPPSAGNLLGRRGHRIGDPGGGVLAGGAEQGRPLG